MENLRWPLGFSRFFMMIKTMTVMMCFTSLLSQVYLSLPVLTSIPSIPISNRPIPNIPIPDMNDYGCSGLVQARPNSKFPACRLLPRSHGTDHPKTLVTGDYCPSKKFLKLCSNQITMTSTSGTPAWRSFQKLNDYHNQ